MGRKGPGLLLRDLGRADDQIDAVAAIVAQVAPDILLLTDVDYDRDGLAVQALADRMGFAHSFALLLNAGMATGLDLDGNGRVGEARDAQGYGLFSGDSGMALLSRWPINADAVQDLSPLLWRDLPWATLPNGPLWTDEIANIQRLSTTGQRIAMVCAIGTSCCCGRMRWTVISALRRRIMSLRAMPTLTQWTATADVTRWPRCWPIRA